MNILGTYQKGQMQMDYSKIIELDNVTLEDCIDLYEKKNMITIINDGRIINFEKEN